MSKLFEDDASDSDGDIQTNNDYATRYNVWREKEEYNKLKTKYGDHVTANFTIEEPESDSSSSDDEDGKYLQDLEKDFFKTLANLKRKDPKIYDNKVVFFNKTIGHNENSQEPKTKSKKPEPMFMKDYERKMILEKGAKFEESDEEELEEDPRAHSPTYVEEQRRIKESLRKAVEDENEDEEKWGGLFQKRQKTKEEQDKEEEDYKKWLKGNKEHLDNTEMETELKSLKDYWQKPDLNKEEEFLRDYLLNKRYIEKENEDHIPTYEEIIHDSDDNLSEDEKNIEKQEEFEVKYNFRYEEPDPDFIKRYPRTAEHSVRQTDDRRKEKRAEIKQRKEEEKKEKKEDLKQLKILKRKEIEEKIKKIKEITGNQQMAFQEMDIDGDFDPEEHDRRMQELFDNQYYGGEEGDQKPEFSDFEEELGPWKDKNELHCEDDDFNMDCDFDPIAAKKDKNKKEKKKRKKQGKSSKNNDEDELPVDENDEKYGEYMDEMYQLDYEDMIGDIPCRFKYRDVVANDFGLSVEEILLAKDKELNRWCSLKKTTQYRPEQAERYDVIAYQKKAANNSLKMKYLPSLFDEIDEEVNENEVSNSNEKNTEKAQVNTEEIVEENRETKKSKKRKRNADISEENIEKEENIDNEENKETKENDNKISKKKKKNKHKNVNEDNAETEENIDNEETIETEENDNKKSKKKKKNKPANVDEENTKTELSTNNKKSKKKNKYIKDNQDEINKNLNNKSAEDEQNEENENIENTNTDDVLKLNKKSKNKRKLSTNEKIESETPEIKQNNSENVGKKKSKKKKKRKNNKSVEKTGNEQKIETEISDTPKKLSRRHKKNKKLVLSKPAVNVKEENINKQKKRKLSDVPEENTNKQNKKIKLSNEKVESTNTSSKKKQKLNKNNKFKKNNSDKTTKLSDSRLEAYGINPKKFKNKLKYKNKVQ